MAGIPVLLLLLTCLIGGLMVLPDRNLPTPASSHLTLFLSGDVMTGRGIDQVLPQSVAPKLYEDYVKDARDYVRLAENKSGRIPQPVPYAYIWGDALEVWKAMAPDLKIINLETSITTNPESWPGKAVQYRMHPGNVPVLKAAGINFCTLANNHVLDWGRPGLLETITTLREAGITLAGAGKDLREARRPAIFKFGENRVLIFAYGAPSSGVPEEWSAGPETSGVNFLPDFSNETFDLVKQQIKAVRKSGDLVIFSVHWGSNWGYDVPSGQRTFAHRLIDEAGVDLVHGHSSHHPRGLEVYKNKLILYGAGDFVSDYEGIGSHEKYRSDLSLMYFSRLDPDSGRLISLKLIPMQTRRFRLERAGAADAAWLARVLDSESGKFGTQLELQPDGSIQVKWPGQKDLH